MARTSFGSGIGEGKVETISDSRYGLREHYDDAEMKKTKEYYRKGDALAIKEVENPLLQTVKTVKAK